MRCYALGTATRGAEIVQCFCEGVNGQFVRHATSEYEGGDIVVWGLLRGGRELRRKCAEAGNTYYAIDHAYIGRERYFRITRSGFQQTEIFERPPDRWKALSDRYGIDVKPWKQAGRYVLLALSSHMNDEYFGVTGWEGMITQQLRMYTDRKIVVRPKGCHDRLQDQLKEAWCVVTHTSMVAVDAVLAGVPVFVTGPSIARPMGLTDLSKIESPVYPERRQWMNSLAYAQFDTRDMKAGKVKPWLDEFPVRYDHYGY